MLTRSRLRPDDGRGHGQPQLAEEEHVVAGAVAAAVGLDRDGGGDPEDVRTHPQHHPVEELAVELAHLLGPGEDPDR
jgi:hypothetical protein